MKICLSKEEVKQKLIEKGIRPTAQRVAICFFVFTEADHPTVDEIKKWLDLNYPKMSLATVYNNLNLLVAAGCLKALKFSHSDKVFYDNNLTKHYHFLDEESGKLIDIEANDLSLSDSLKKRFEVHDIEVLIKGKRVS